MRKTIIISVFALLGAMAAQAVIVEPAQRIDGVPTAWHPVLSTDGQRLLFSAEDHTGLKCLNLADGTLETIDKDAAAGFNPVFAADGKTVVYTTARLIDGLTNRDVRKYTPGAGNSKVVKPMSRRDNNINVIAGNTNYATADYDKIIVTVNGVSTALSPLADAHSYLWASLSPDGTRLLFTEPFKGVYVSNPDGTSPRRLAAKGDFAAWAGNNIVVYIESHDDGYQTLDSQLKAIDLTTGATTTVTDTDVIVSEATAAHNGRVVYSTIQGELYQTTIK